MTSNSRGLQPRKIHTSGFQVNGQFPFLRLFSESRGQTGSGAKCDNHGQSDAGCYKASAGYRSIRTPSQGPQGSRDQCSHPQLISNLRPREKNLNGGFVGLSPSALGFASVSVA